MLFRSSFYMKHIKRHSMTPSLWKGVSRGSCQGLVLFFRVLLLLAFYVANLLPYTSNKSSPQILSQEIAPFFCNITSNLFKEEFSLQHSNFVFKDNCSVIDIVVSLWIKYVMLLKFPGTRKKHLLAHSLMEALWLNLSN